MTTTLVKENIQLSGLQFTSLTHYQHGGKCEGMQEVMVLEMELRFLDLDLQGAGSGVRLWAVLSIYESQSPPPQ